MTATFTWSCSSEPSLRCLRPYFLLLYLLTLQSQELCDPVLMPDMSFARIEYFIWGSSISRPGLRARRPSFFVPAQRLLSYDNHLGSAWASIVIARFWHTRWSLLMLLRFSIVQVVSKMTY